MSGWRDDDRVTVYVTQGSGNSFKPALALKQLGIAHWLQFVDVLGGETRQPAFMAINDMGQVPYLVGTDGRGLGESNAMLWFIAEGSPLIPADPMDRAEMLRWMFFEQTRLEPAISPARLYSFILPHRQEEFRAEFPQWRRRAQESLALLDRHLATSDFIVGRHGYSIGDIAVFGYVHLADQAGVSLVSFPHVAAWIERVTQTPGFVPIDQLLDPARGKLDYAGSLAA